MAKKKEKTKKEKLPLNPHKMKILVVGIGGGAASIISEMAKDLKKVHFLVADTDQRSFKKLPSNVRSLCFGNEITKGWGTGMNSELGKKAALNIKEKIKKTFNNWDLIVLVSCLGGGVSSGSSIIFSQVLKENNIMSLGVLTLPFNFEGEKKMRLAKSSLSKIKNNLSGFAVLPNEEILKYSDKKLSLKKSFSLMNQVLIDYFRNLIEVISTPGIINIDFADLRSILKGRGRPVYFGQGSGQGPNRAEEAVKKIFEGPFFYSPTKIKRILFNISNNGDLTLKEVKEISEKISSLNPRAKIIFGVSKSSAKAGKKIKITILGVGEERQEKPAVKKVKHTSKNKKKKKEKKIKVKIRRSALEVKKAEKDIQEKEMFGENKWDIPTFLRHNE